MTNIYINIYDLSKTNKLLRNTKFTIYHTSVRIGNSFEIYYGFSEYGKTGIDYSFKLDTLPSCMSGTLYSTILMGSTSKSCHEIKAIAKRFEQNPAWLSDRYNVIYHNCHQFSYWFCSAILGSKNLQNYPSFVLEMEKLGSPIYDNLIQPVISKMKTPPFFFGKCPEALQRKKRNVIP